MLSIIQADYHNPVHAAAILKLMAHYAEDPMGGAEPLSVFTRQNLIAEMQQRPTLSSILAFDGDSFAGNDFAANDFADSNAVGLINVVEGFSTFAAKPLLNVHDVVVLAGYRGQGIVQKMLAAVEQLARDRGCCKLTLEVLQGNVMAQQSYCRFGFEPYRLNPAMGDAVFWQKYLTQ